MSEAPVEQDEPEEGTSDDFAIYHFICCSDDVAMCGEKMEHFVEMEEEPTEVMGEPTGPVDRPCPLCAHIYDNGLPCTVPECSGQRD